MATSTLAQIALFHLTVSKGAISADSFLSNSQRMWSGQKNARQTGAFEAPSGDVARVFL